jgi:hypothetical protein
MSSPKFERVFRPSVNAQTLIDNLIKRKKNFILRETQYYTQIICDGVETVYKGKNKGISFPSNQLWLFQSVKRDAVKFLESQNNFIPKTKMPTNLYNFDYDLDRGQITGTDITSAYWYIAHNQGVISEKTFTRALEPEFKVVKLAALAVLGRQMVYNEYRNGQKQLDKVVIPYSHPHLKDVYRNIRYECYYHMGQMALLLGEDFFSYKTDAIYYRDTVENREKVHGYLEERGFKFSQLDYEDEEIESLQNKL